MVNRPTKRGSTSLIIREMQIKTTRRYDFTAIKRAFSKNPTNNTCRRGCGERKPPAPWVGVQAGAITATTYGGASGN